MNKIDPTQLKRIGLFEGLNDEQVDKIAHIMRIRNFKAGDTIIREGEMGGELFVLLTGTIEVSKRFTLLGSSGADQRDKSLVRLSDDMNIFFGEMTMFGSEERSATVTALSETSLGVLTAEQMHLLANKDASIGYRLFFNIGKTLANNLRRANRDILKLTTAFCLALESK